jgi:hypothetical protein
VGWVLVLKIGGRVSISAAIIKGTGYLQSLNRKFCISHITGRIEGFNAVHTSKDTNAIGGLFKCMPKNTVKDM